MSVALVVLHVFVCIFLIAVVLLQRGRGAEIGAVFGGGASGTVFGSRGAGSFLSRLTTASAVVFMLTSLGLSYLWTRAEGDRLFSDPEATEEEAAAPPAAPAFEQLGEVPPPAPGSLPALPEPAAPAGEAPAAP